MCSLIEHFPVTLYAHIVFSKIAKICPLLKSLGSILERLSYIVIWIWMRFLACSPCCRWVGKGTLCCGLPHDFWGFFGVSWRTTWSADTFPVLPIQEHLRMVLIFQDARFAKPQVVWSIPAENRSPQLRSQLQVCGEIQLLWVSSLTIIQDSQKMCWMSWWAFCTADLLKTLQGQQHSAKLESMRPYSRHSRTRSQPVDLQADCNSLLSDVPWAQTLRHLQLLTFFFFSPLLAQ